MPGGPNWRDSAAYAYLENLDAPELAWEFLRRNTEYRSAFERSDRRSIPVFDEHLITQWGLPFPGRSGPQRNRRRNILDSII